MERKIHLRYVAALTMMLVSGLLAFALKDSPIFSPRDFKSESFALLNAAGTGHLKTDINKVRSVCIVQTLFVVHSASAELFPVTERASYGSACRTDPASCCKVDNDTRSLILFKTIDGIECRNAQVSLRKRDGVVPKFACRPPHQIRKLLDDIYDVTIEQ